MKGAERVASGEPWPPKRIFAIVANWERLDKRFSVRYIFNFTARSIIKRTTLMPSAV